MMRREALAVGAAVEKISAMKRGIVVGGVYGGWRRMMWPRVHMQEKKEEEKKMELY